jgi:hypothetical protein
MDINLKEKEEGIGIQNIEIRFISNVSPDTVNKLNRGMFYLPGDKENSENKDAPGKEGMKGGKTTTDSEYPYFTDTSQLNIDKLSKLSRPDLLDAFFNKKKFKRYLDKGKSSDRDTRLLNSDFNINVMMKLLLCTTFPVKHNIQNTFSENITQVASNSQSDATSVIDMIKNIVSKPFDKYCYFTIDGTQYTLLSITHINDLINDKIFDNTFNTLFAFKQWRDRKIQKLEAERVDLNTTFQKAFDTNFKQMKDTLNTKDYKGHIDKLADSRQLALPRLLLKPYLDVLKSETSQNSVEIAFLKIANLNYTGSKETSASFWLPPVFARIAGFTEMMKSIFESTIIQKQLIYLKSDLTDLKKIMKKSNEKKTQLKDADEEIAIDKLQKTNEINDFLNKIKKITPPMRMYSNRKLEDMFEKLNNDDLFKFIQFIHDMKKEENLDKSLFNNKAYIDKLKTGVMSVIKKNESSDKEPKDLFGISSKKYYDTFVSLDLIKGELNKDNIDAIKCPYKNTMLSNEYLKLQDLSNEKNPALIYIPTIVLDMKVLKQNNKSNKRRTQRKRKQNGGWQPEQMKRATRRRRKKDKKQSKKKNSEDIKSIKSINSVDSKSVKNDED